MAQSIDSLESVTETEYVDESLFELEAVVDTELSAGGDDVSFFQGDTSTLTYEDQILFELKVTNGLLGISLAMNIFFLGLFFFVFFLKVIKNNVTNLIT